MGALPCELAWAAEALDRTVVRINKALNDFEFMGVFFQDLLEIQAG